MDSVVPGSKLEDDHSLPPTQEEIRKKRLEYFRLTQGGVNSNKVFQRQKPADNAIVSATLPIDDNDNHRDSKEILLDSSSIILKNPLTNTHPYAEQITLSGRLQKAPDTKEISIPTKYQDLALQTRSLVEKLNKEISGSEAFSVMNSIGDVDELGLKTHRPGFHNEANFVQKEREIPSNETQGQSKASKELFSPEIQEQMKSALGDKGLQELMLKVEKDIEQLHRGRSFNKNFNREGIIKDQHPTLSSFESTDQMHEESNPGSQISGKTHLITKNLEQLREGEKDAFKQLRNYDQMIVPRNTKNAFSADEIYRQAYGDKAESALFEKPLSRNTDPMLNSTNQNSRQWLNHATGHSEYAHPNESYYSPIRKLSHDGSVQTGNIPPFVSTHNQFAYPPPQYYSRSFDYPGPVSPHSSALYGSVHEGQHQFYLSSHNQQQKLPHQDNSYTIAPNFTSNMPTDTLSITSSPRTYNYPPPPFHNYFGVPKFRDGVPLHLPPPPLPSNSKSQEYGSPLQFFPPHPPPTSARRHSNPHIGSSGHQHLDFSAVNSVLLKNPHPPPVPPALHRKEPVFSNSENRYPSVVGMQTPIQKQAPEVYSIHSQSGDTTDFKLHKYFASLEPQDSNTMVPELVLSSSHISEDTHRNEDAVSMFTDAGSMFTDVTSAYTAEGVTGRLKGLGIDLNHLKHLRIIEDKGNKVTPGADFETLSKGIKCCPECGSSNKGYMDWCGACGEVLIGVEMTMPVRKSKSSSGREKRTRGGTKMSQGVRVSQLDLGDNLQDFSEDCSSHRYIYPHKDSPESGRGQSLSNSPDRNDRHNETDHPMDSGRASSGDVREVTGVWGEEKSSGCEQDLDALDKAPGCEQDLDAVDKAPGCEQDLDALDKAPGWEISQSQLFDQIKDPVLRQIVLAYNKKQISGRTADTNEREAGIVKSNLMEKGAESLQTGRTLDDKLPHSVTFDKITNPQSHETKLAPEMISWLQGHQVSQMESHNGTYSEPNFIEADRGKAAEPKKVKKRRKKKKQIDEAMDIEIFGYEESHQSRNSSRIANNLIVPILNLACTSDEEETDTDVSDADDDFKITGDVSHKFVNQPDADSEAALVPSQGSGPHVSINKNRSSVRLQQITSVSPPPVSLSQSKASNNNRVGCSSSGPTRYQRHWARSSIAWGSFHPRELSTRSSINNMPHQNVNGNPASAKMSRSATAFGEVVTDRGMGPGNNGSSIGSHPVRQRPASAEYGPRRSEDFNRRPRPSSAKFRAGYLGQQSSRLIPEPPRAVKTMSPTSSQRVPTTPLKPGSPPQRPASAAGSLLSDIMSTNSPLPQTDRVDADSSRQTCQGADDSPRLLCAELHRLPHEVVEELHPADKLHAVAKNTYDKLQEMTPRITEGEVSRWQCLPDEIWLYVFNFLSQGDLKRLMLTCHYFYRLANDETLWRYITVKSRCAMTDTSLATIAHHRPLSVAMVKCQGTDVTLDGLHHFFKETQGRLRELNICGCSQGSLVGSVILQVAAQYCQQLTHLDASYCNVSDEAFIAISQCADRLESVCVNGFQSMSDESLTALLKKHGTSLRTLELYACFSLNASVLRSLGEHCLNLRRLCLGSCNKLTDSAMISLSIHLARVEELDLRGCKNLRNDCIRKIVHNCSRIHTLVLANCQQISDLALTEIATYLKATLRVLDVCGCNRVSDQGVISLAKNCDRLTTVDISSTRCTSVSVNHLASNSRCLETVKLSFLSGLSESCITNLIKQCHRLKLLHVFGCSSLRNLARFHELNPKLCIEGDADAPRHTYF